MTHIWLRAWLLGAAARVVAGTLISVCAFAPAAAQMKQNWMYASSVPVHAQKPAFPVPEKPIRVVVAEAAGSAADLQARAVAPRLAELLSVPVEIDNRPGGGTLIAAQEVLNALPDGHTLFYASTVTLAQAPHVLSGATFDPMNDFAPLTTSTRSAMLLLGSKAVAASNLAELAAFAKAQRDPLKYGSTGVGSAAHILGANLALASGVTLQHVVCANPAACLDDLAAGRIQLAFAAAPEGVRLARAGQVRLLAAAAPQRSPLAQDVPTLQEQGLRGIDAAAFYAWYAPGGVRPETVVTLHAALAAALQQAPVQAAIKAGGYSVESSTPQELTAQLKGAYDAWGELVRRAGVARQAP